VDDDEDLLRSRQGWVEILTLNRPAVRNALDPDLMSALIAALRRAAADDDVRAVVLTGSGTKAFCSGMDLRAFRDAPSGRGAGGLDVDELMWFFHGGFPKPAIAAVNGPAVAGGFELVLACDLAVAAPHATFGIPEVRRGLVAAGGGTALATRVPLALALELGLTGDTIDAARALAVGLVNRVVPTEQVLAEAVGLAERIAGNAPLAVRLTRDLMRAGALVHPERAWPTPQQQALLLDSHDAREGASAFVDKRAPNWLGR